MKKSREPVWEVVFGRCLIEYSPTNRLSDDPVESKRKLWHHNTHPCPSSSSTNPLHVHHSVKPDQTDSSKYCWCKNPVHSSESSFLCLKQRNIFSHTLFSHSLSLLSHQLLFSWWTTTFQFIWNMSIKFGIYMSLHLGLLGSHCVHK